ncbi:MAG: cytochrome P450 [Pseudomonadota bacterium]
MSEVERARTCPLHEVSPMHPELLVCPYQLNARLQDEAPVFEDPTSGIFFVSRYADVLAMAMDHATFSSIMPGSGRAAQHSNDAEVAAIMAQGYPNVPTMLTQDPPLQRRYRKFVDGAFAPRSLKALEPFIEATANRLIDRMIERGSCEFLEDFGVPLPLSVIANQLGVPLQDLPLLRKWTNAFIANLSQQLDREGVIATAKVILEFQHYFVERMEERRAQPQDDILSQVVNASIDGEKPLDNAECLSMLSQILVAGNETTASAFTEGMWQLLQHPQQAADVYANPDQETIHRLVEETLRISSPSANMFRRTTRSVELHGVTIPENAICFARFAAANYDPRKFPEPERFDLRRDNLKEQVAFGRGVHHCLGAALSRREMNISFRVLFERLTNFRLRADSPPPRFLPNALLHGLDALHLEFDVR